MKVTFNRDWFRRANKTQRQVAEETQIDEAYLSKVVRGHIQPSVIRALSIAESLGCTVEDLYRSEPDGGSPSTKHPNSRVRRASSNR